MNVLSYLSDLWALGAAALTLDLSTLRSLLSQPQAGWLAFGLVLVAGISRLVGDSVVLFINHVPARRFGTALLAGAFLFALDLVIWAFSIWLLATILFNATQTVVFIFLLVAMASAPWLFGFLVFLPYFGLLVRWILRIWSWLILLALLQATLSMSPVTAFVAATGGWLVLRLLEHALSGGEKPIYGKFWARVMGKAPELNFAEQSDALAKELRKGASRT
jgi:hypothetical protein